MNLKKLNESPGNIRPPRSSTTSTSNLNPPGGIPMKRTIACLAVVVLAAIAFFAASSAVYALYEVIDKGTWPKSWPRELEPLRQQARTLVGPEAAFEHYQIPFTNREQFESACSHPLKVKSKAAPIILVRGTKTDFMEIKPAGVLIHSPPDKSTNPQEPNPAQT